MPTYACMYIYTQIPIGIYGHPPNQYPWKGGFSNLDVTSFFSSFIKHRTRDTLQRKSWARVPTAHRPVHTSVGCKCLTRWVKNKPTSRRSPPACTFANRSKDLLTVTAITAHISWPSESDLLALPLSESIRKSSGSAWLAETSDLPCRIREGKTRCHSSW